MSENKEDFREESKVAGLLIEEDKIYFFQFKEPYFLENGKKRLKKK